MKSLKPAHREHRRYLLISGKDADKRGVEEAILAYVGILGYSKASPQFIKSEDGKDKLILSINREELDKVRASFVLSGKDIHIDRVSGMINKL